MSSQVLKTSTTPATVPRTQISIDSKVIATTTGTKCGIDLGIGECFLSHGAAKVYANDVGETGDGFTQFSQRHPGQLFSVYTNVTVEATITAAICRIAAEAWAFHGLVVNAGRTHHKAALDFTEDERATLLYLNLFGAFYSSHPATTVVIQQGICG